MRLISNRDYDIIISKLPIVLAKTSDPADTQFTEAKRMLSLTRDKLIKHRAKSKPERQ